MDKYQIIYADPPWEYKDKAKAGKRGSEFKYPCMNIEDIKSLPVSNICADNAALFLWCTAPQLPVGFEVMKAWGFQYKTIAFTWVKLNKKPVASVDIIKDSFKYNTLRGFKAPHLPENIRVLEGDTEHGIDIYSDFMGMGSYSRQNSEFCLLGIKGKMKRQSASVRQVVMSSREEHSKKPNEVRDRIVQLFGDLPRIELFARQHAPGWDVWGDEVESDIAL